VAGVVINERNGKKAWPVVLVALLLALPLAVIVIGAGALYGIDRVQSDVSSQTEAALDAAGIDPDSVDIDATYRDVSINGTLPDFVTVDEVRSAVSSSVAGLGSLDLDGLAGPGPADTASDTADDAPASTAPTPTTSTTEAPATTPTTTTTGAPVAEAENASPQVTELQASLDQLTNDFGDDTPFFSSSSDDLSPEALDLLDSVAALLVDLPDTNLQIIGHTDDRGEAETNLTLSASRAEAVVIRLAFLGIDRSRLEFEGAGEFEPIADNSTEEGQRANRRVEFTALDPA